MKESGDFLDLLCDPVSGEGLTFDGDDVLYSPGKKSVYHIKNNVFVLLADKQYPKDAFNYREHYEKDAIVFNYGNEFDNPIEISEVSRLRQTILSKVPFDGDGKWILDVGCGGAWVAGTLLSKNKKVISMDISSVNPEKAIKNFPSENHFAIVADVLGLPLKKNSVDCIIASEIIEHVVDPEQLISNLLDILKPGGKLIITTPFNEKIRYSLCIHCNRMTPHNAHLHSFTENSIKKLIPKKAAFITTAIFNSKVLVRMHITFFCRFLPLKIWRPIDHFFILITGKKAYRLMVEITK